MLPGHHWLLPAGVDAVKRQQQLLLLHPGMISFVNATPGTRLSEKRGEARYCQLRGAGALVMMAALCVLYTPCCDAGVTEQLLQSMPVYG